MESDLRSAYAELQQRNSNQPNGEALDINTYVEEYTKQRMERQKNFLKFIEQQRNEQIAEYLKDNMSREE